MGVVEVVAISEMTIVVRSRFREIPFPFTSFLSFQGRPLERSESSGLGRVVAVCCFVASFPCLDVTDSWGTRRLEGKFLILILKEYRVDKVADELLPVWCGGV